MTMIHQFRREAAQVQQQAAAATVLLTTHGFPWLLTSLTILEGWAFNELGQPVAGLARSNQGLAAYRASGSTNKLSNFLAILSEGYGALGQTQTGLTLLAEALDWIERTDERWWEAEVYRLQGELLQQQGAPLATVETCFEQAIAIAQRQQAKALELRATVSLCKLWQARGKDALALHQLAPIYGWFSEGFATPDLIEAKQLLDNLSIGPKNHHRPPSHDP